MASAQTASAPTAPVSTGVQLALVGQQLALDAQDVQPWPVVAAAWIDDRPAGAAFSADDLVSAVGLPRGPGGLNAAVGAVIGAARRRGLIRAIGWEASTRAATHGRAVRVWERVAA